MLFERVTGPIRGYHIATYACEVGELGHQYLGYYKICAAEPTDYFEAAGLLKGCGDTHSVTAEQALRVAEDLARRQIGNMPVLADLPAFHEKRPLYWFEREVLEGPGAA